MKSGKECNIDKDEEITIPFLEPRKYLMKAIFDRNKMEFGIQATSRKKLNRKRSVIILAS